eukprot:gene5818-11738_t
MKPMPVLFLLLGILSVSMSFFVNSFISKFPCPRKTKWAIDMQRTDQLLPSQPSLMPDPMPNSIGNFFENKTDDMSFIQCYMTSMCKINGSQYGVGFPVDMPVMLSFFEGNELMPVRPDYPDFDHLVNHVSVQMDYNDFQLYKTPVVLTLQGEFEDEFMNEILPTLKHKRKTNSNEDDEVEDGDGDNELEDDDEGKMDEKFKNMPDYTIFRPENPDVSDIPADAFVTDEDSKGLRKAHRRADRIMEYATDVALIASFHYKKKNFHLVKLLEPIFIIGKRIEDIKGYYFTLLDDNEGDKIAPIIENLVLNKAKEIKPPAPKKPDDWRKRS